jgi:ABC-type polysaccharide/polyol phosphate transport system ATPase subunit
MCCSEGSTPLWPTLYDPQMIDIAVVRVSKRYKIPRFTKGRESSFLKNIFPAYEEIWAVREVSFEVLRGEALGIVGHNGAGKSTLIKLLSGITVPTTGQLTIRGSLSTLVDVTAGFNFELTGRDNVFLAGSILGMKRRDIADKINSITEFAGIGHYFDAPVKKYSTGMLVRLGFSIAAHLECDIILLDEVLAVGDVAFQARCFDRIEQLRRDGRTIVLISHDLASVERICDRAILMNRGELVMSGRPREIIEEYARTAYAAMGPGRETLGEAELIDVRFECPSGGPVRTGDPMLVRVAFKLKNPLEQAVVSISLNWPSGYLCTQLTSEGAGDKLSLPAGSITLEFFCPALSMQRGLYSAGLAIEQKGQEIGHWPRCALLRVVAGRIILGDFYLEHSCRLVPSDPKVLMCSITSGQE